MAISLIKGDCLVAMRDVLSDSLDACVTDPPYGLSFMDKNWDHGVPGIPFWREVYRVLKPGAHIVAFGGTRTYHRMACAIENAGFEIRDSLMWVYGVGFPKSHNISGHETFCQCGAEPATERSLRSMQYDDVSETISNSATSRKVLQPSLSKCGPQSVRSEQGEGIAGSAQSGLEGRSDIPSSSRQLCTGEIRSLPSESAFDGASGRLRDGAPSSHGVTNRSTADTNGMCASSGSQAAQQRGNESRIVAGQPQSQNGRAWEDCGRCGKPMVPDGYGTALKPAFEPIVLARKPLSEKTVAANVLRWGTGALNIDGCRVEHASEADRAAATPQGRVTAKSGSLAGKAQYAGCDDYAPDTLNPIEQDRGICTNCFLQAVDHRTRSDFIRPDTSKGRWPANVVHDGSDEVVGAFPEAKGAQGIVTGKEASTDERYILSGLSGNHAPRVPRNDSGSAARFFYSAKASKADRNGSKHPTVKPISLMQWLVRLITPPGGTVLDPFAGSGTTGAACEREGFDCILIEKEAEYQRDIETRMRIPVQASLDDV